MELETNLRNLSSSLHSRDLEPTYEIWNLWRFETNFTVKEKIVLIIVKALFLARSCVLQWSVPIHVRFQLKKNLFSLNKVI